jgi:hypothetical protein
VRFITVTRPDGSHLALNPGNILSIAEAPPQNSPLAGPPGGKARITFSNQTHQDVRETVAELLVLIEGPAPPTA